MSPSPQAFLTALRNMTRRLTEIYSSPFEGGYEEQLKSPMCELVEMCADELGRRVTTRLEVGLGAVGRPDITVLLDHLPIGYVELKAPGKGTVKSNFRGHDKDQFERFEGLPNLIYTDGNEFTLYRSGKKEQSFRLGGDVKRDGESAVKAGRGKKLHDMLITFFDWTPIVPSDPQQLAETLAPFSLLLRDDVLVAVQDSDSNLSKLAEDWRRYLFPDADAKQFADAYAQTVTYALLLARFEGAQSLATPEAVESLQKGHGLLSEVLRVLRDKKVDQEIGLGADLIQRTIEAADLDALHTKEPDPWLYFYEHFLAEYDPALRNDRGVYYTPTEVVGTQVRLVSELLQQRLGKPLSFADDDIVLLDPAVGTGTYPLMAFKHGIDVIKAAQGEGATSGAATRMAESFHAFEILVGPYAVAHLRLTERVLDEGGALPEGGAQVYLTDTLESPGASLPGQATLFHKRLTDEHKRAQEIKATTRVLVCIGNPPYDRQQIDPSAPDVEERKGGWVRFGDTETDRAILADFIEPAQNAGRGVHVKNLYNDYVYFWRWALWKVFEQVSGPGIVSFITASSYLRGPGFGGMRERLRRTCDELWIIDLEGDGRGARKTENVFNIQTPVAIAVAVRYGNPNPSTPAKAHYAKVSGSRKEKYTALQAIDSLEDLTWRDCFSGWQEPLLPSSDGDYQSWPDIRDLFPWQHSGVQYKRTWPIGEDKKTLEARWRELVESGFDDGYFRVTAARSPWGSYQTSGNTRSAPLNSLGDSECPATARYSYRSFDRHYAFADARFADRFRPSLWSVHSDRQVFITSFLTDVLGEGPAAVATCLVPDLHHFRGSFGGKHVIPLFRDGAGTKPNVTSGLLDYLSGQLDRVVTETDLAAYVYGILGSPAYTEAFSEELLLPGPHIPLTRDNSLFEEAIAHGRHLIWLHTYGERLVPEGEEQGVIRGGDAKCKVGVPSDPDGYPEAFDYNRATEALTVGKGRFSPVRKEVWEFSVSGLQVLHSWLSYRMKGGAGKSSSPLDDIRPESWSAEFTTELLELLWILEHTLDRYPAMEETLQKIVAGPTLAADELPSPSDEERKAPSASTATADQGSLTLDED